MGQAGILRELGTMMEHIFEGWTVFVQVGLVGSGGKMVAGNPLGRLNQLKRAGVSSHF
jgi:hypothetical protein